MTVFHPLRALPFLLTSSSSSDRGQSLLLVPWLLWSYLENSYFWVSLFPYPLFILFCPPSSSFLPSNLLDIIWFWPQFSAWLDWTLPQPKAVVLLCTFKDTFMAGNWTECLNLRSEGVGVRVRVCLFVLVWKRKCLSESKTPRLLCVLESCLKARHSACLCEWLVFPAFPEGQLSISEHIFEAGTRRAHTRTHTQNTRLTLSVKANKCIGLTSRQTFPRPTTSLYFTAVLPRCGGVLGKVTASCGLDLRPAAFLCFHLSSLLMAKN